MKRYVLTPQLMAHATDIIARCQDILKRKLRRCAATDALYVPCEVRDLSERCVILKDGVWRGRSGHMVYKELGDA